ncbi:DUF6083 domain-containing protein [Streptomyces griseus]|uniref:DUF6083 domain-containing protein n=1 Tax=Streptomyces griseus TaxID=1911 RepID=UPI000A90279B|nr:DUF6083 domain-containing protein [Streptomyces griseus]
MGAIDESDRSGRTELGSPDEAAGQHLVAVPGPDGHRQRPPGTAQVWENVDRAQAATEHADGPEPPDPPLCPQCGLAGERRPTYYGRYILLEPVLSAPAHRVPAGHRWYVDAGGRAWNGGGDEPEPGAVCRVSHRLACPGLTWQEVGLVAWLDEVRAGNERRARRQADEGRAPGHLPDTG